MVLLFQEVRVGPADNSLSASVDLDDMCSSPPAPPLTPPSSPNVQVRESPWEPLELQLDYWPIQNKSSECKAEKGKQEGKISQKGLFRALVATPNINLSIHLATKEKKQKSKIILSLIFIKYK